MLLDCQDPDGAKRRLTAWWEGELADRVTWAILAHTPEPRFAPPAVPPPTDAEDRWTNAEARFAGWLHTLAHTEYLGDAIPYFDTNIGPGSLGMLLGAHPVFDPGTVWYKPCLTRTEDAADLTFDSTGHWFGKHMGLVRHGLERCDGRFYVSIPDLIEGLDTLAALRGNEAVLFDLHDRPAAVHRALERITDLYFAAYDPIYNLVHDADGGCCFCAFQTWAPGRYAKLQCDFSAMLGPVHFAEFVVPYLAPQCERLDYTMYHLDGPTCVCHLDLLLAIPRLRAIQWTPGAGAPGVEDPCWYDMYRRILSQKSLILLGVPLASARGVVEALGARGLYMTTWTDDRDGALRALEEAERWR